ncbi:hypothetical protein Clacol_009607 [Clathrus columnatus]|uniref:GST N-terminal domain-containing protein n=1 Tax=Clathrus columnatus TaxID=1419009 RepID=A0AAV5AKZ3_9AGAM|nr:hypothetical protein Clacol_009607 [Clathrus columnatus]
MSPPSIVLYDVPGKSKPWNTLTIKTRMVLEYKKIPYRTVWIEYPEIKPTMISIGAKPGNINPTDGSPLYTVPVILDEINVGPDGKPVPITDSWVIAEYLDEKFPDRPLFPKGTKGLQRSFHESFTKIGLFGIVCLIMTPFYENLNEASQPYFRSTREVYFKKPITELRPPKGSAEWDEAWKALEKGLDELATNLDKNGPVGDHPYVMGDIFSYSDITVASALYTISTIYPTEWENIRKWNGGRWGGLLNKCSALITQK